MLAVLGRMDAQAAALDGEEYNLHKIIHKYRKTNKNKSNLQSEVR